MIVVKSKQEQVLDYLQKYGSITPETAYKVCHTMRLSGLIFNLRRKGYDIKTEIINKTNEEGRHISYACYILQDA